MTKPKSSFVVRLTKTLGPETLKMYYQLFKTAKDAEELKQCDGFEGFMLGIGVATELIMQSEIQALQKIDTKKEIMQ